MVGMMEAIEDYLGSCNDIMRAPLAYIIRKTTLVQTYGDYLIYAPPDNEMIARMLHLPPERTSSFLSIMLSQLEHIQQSTR